MAFWDYCFTECPLFGIRNYGILGRLFSRMPPVRKPWHSGKTVFQNAPCSETMAFWEGCFPECHGFWTGGILNPECRGFRVICPSLSLLNKVREKWYKPVNNVKIPPFSSGHWNRCRPRASKTALGPRATLYSPQAVLEALGQHLFQSPSEKGRILAHNPNSMSYLDLHSVSFLFQRQNFL